MAIAWSTQQEASVSRALTNHGLDTGHCALAAAHILPVARERDRNAVARRCDPCFGRYVNPTRRWFHHVAVTLEEHYVDALTDPPGLEAAVYMSKHWADAKAFSWKDLADKSLAELCK